MTRLTLTAATALALAFTPGFASAQERTEFRVAWSIYVGWMPWGWRNANRPSARLTVLDGGAVPRLATRLGTAAAGIDWFGPGAGGRIVSIDARAGWIETDAGRLSADVVNYVPRKAAGPVARGGGLADADGWCPCDAGGRSVLHAAAYILGDARRDGLRSVTAARSSALAAAAALVEAL